MLWPIQLGLLWLVVAAQQPKGFRGRLFPMNPHLDHWPRAQRRRSWSASPRGIFSLAATPPPDDTQQPLGPSSCTGEVLFPELGSGARLRGHGAVVSVVPGSCCSAPESPDNCANDAFRVEGRRLL
ncbi:hypothetical protein NDU88_000091 [Pleurodeles waltl]|uniref:Uncharacterized protein n=1 Tax=Pleurodeles waltl TaxID=8319 RepID=A0AAV7S3K5_PLEWA|nr:hypothetical protein NDU88_000091 [Pleurodeles waltl]